jgi:hypothetical protein
MRVDSLSLENLQEQIEQLRYGLPRFINDLQRATPGSLGFGPSLRPLAGD